MSILTRFEGVLFALALAASPVVARAAPTGSDVEDPEMQLYRERFKQGLDRYEANDVAGALSFWEPLYRDLGPSRGYRVGYNLARAYEVFGDATRAAERYESFLDEVKQRRAKSEPLDDVAIADEAKATARLDELAKTRGRIHVAPTSPPASVRIDQSEPRLAGFVAYVAPGAHDVVFAPGSPSERAMHVAVQAGQVVEVAQPEPAQRTIVTPTFRDTTRPPFSPVVLWVAGAATLLVGGGVTGGAYANAVASYDHYRAQASLSAPQVADYDSARTLAYASWAVPAALAITTAVLVVWYVTGMKHTKVPVTAAFAF
jgi:hypothetical protein